MTTTLITGASSGIGRALAAELGKAGHTLALVARRASELEETAALARSAGAPDVLCIPTDLSSPDAAQGAARHAEKALGGLDVVVANAGIAKMGSVARLTWEDFDQLTRVNYTGTIALFLAALPGMIARGSGHIVGVSSIAGFRGLPGAAAYSASKAALSTFLESASIDLKKKGVAVTTVSPGYVKTAMTDGTTTPMPFLVDVDDAARIVAKGILARKRHIAFPAPMVLTMKLAQSLPAFVYERVARRP